MLPSTQNIKIYNKTVMTEKHVLSVTKILHSIVYQKVVIIIIMTFNYFQPTPNVCWKGSEERGIPKQDEVSPLR